jgi:hypothetical protein
MKPGKEREGFWGWEARTNAAQAKVRIEISSVHFCKTRCSQLYNPEHIGRDFLGFFNDF